MSPRNRRLLAVGAIASLLGVVAGAAELIAGTVSWAGNKNDPVTLGWVTVGLGVALGAAAALASRSRRPEAQLGAAATLLVVGLVGLTTAGLAWLPAAVAALVAWTIVVRRGPGEATWGAVVRAQWTPALVVVLAVVYLAFGIVHGGALGLVGVLGAVATVACLAVRHRSRPLAAGVLVVGAVPFAAATAWTVVTPLTAALLLLIGLPFLLDRTRTTTPPRKTS